MFLVSSTGAYLGTADSIPDGAIAVPTAPPSNDYTWDGSAWVYARPDWASLSKAVEGSEIMGMLAIQPQYAPFFYMLGDNINREADRRVAACDGVEGLAIARIRWALSQAWLAWTETQQDTIRGWLQDFGFPSDLAPAKVQP